MNRGDAVTTLRIEQHRDKVTVLSPLGELRAFLDEVEIGVVTSEPNDVRIDRDRHGVTVWLGVIATEMVFECEAIKIDGIRIPLDPCSTTLTTDGDTPGVLLPIRVDRLEMVYSS